MANLTITEQSVVVGGVAQTYQTPTTTDTYFFSNDGYAFLHVKKSGANACTVTIETPGNVGGNAIADLTVSIPATTGDKMIGPFPPNIYNQSDGTVKVTFSENTGLSAAALHLG